MSKAYSPSDFTNINVNYSQGNGYYTRHFDVSALLQINEFTDTTTPSRGEVGSIIKRVEDKIDDKVGHPFRPLIYKDEFHNFEFFKHSYYPVQPSLLMIYKQI